MASVVEGSTVTLTTPDVESHIFKGWYDGAVLVLAFLVGSTNTGETSITADYGTKVQMEAADAPEGYRFDQWVRVYGSGDDVREVFKSYDQTIVRRTNQNKLFVAKYAALDEYTTTAVYDANHVSVTFDPDRASYYEGTDVAFSARVLDPYTTITNVKVYSVDGNDEVLVEGDLPASTTVNAIASNYKFVVTSETTYMLETYSNDDAMGTSLSFRRNRLRGPGNRPCYSNQRSSC